MPRGRVPPESSLLVGSLHHQVGGGPLRPSNAVGLVPSSLMSGRNSWGEPPKVGHGQKSVRLMLRAS